MEPVKLKIPDGEVTIRWVPSSEYEVNPNNPNRGDLRGIPAIDASMKETGFTRGVFVANDGTVVGGNHAHQSAIKNGIGGYIEISTTGNCGVATRRLDWDDANVPQAVKAALLDNRTSELNYDPDPAIFAQCIEILNDAGEELPSVAYSIDELNDILAQSIIPDFQPAGEDEQSSLDEIAGTSASEPEEVNCICPECGHHFTRLV